MFKQTIRINRKSSGNTIIILLLLVQIAIFSACQTRQPLKQELSELSVGSPIYLNRFLPELHPLYLERAHAKSDPASKQPNYVVWDLNDDGHMDGIAVINAQGELTTMRFDADFDGALDP